MSIQTGERQAPTTFTFLDSASLYEVATVLHIGDPSKCYPWAWRTAVAVTHSLIAVNKLRVAAAPSPARGHASGLYELVSQAVSHVNVIGTSHGKPNTDAVAETIEWATQNSEYLKATLVKLREDKTNFEPWLQRSIEHAWLEHTTRLNGLFNKEFTAPITAIVGGTSANADELWHLSCDPKQVRTLANKMSDNDDKFTWLRDAYVVSALIRGYYHQTVASGRNEHVLRHPLRAVNPLPVDPTIAPLRLTQHRFRVNSAQSAFASIILAEALRKKNVAERPQRWIDSVTAARQARTSNADSDQAAAIHRLTDDRAGPASAARAAQTLRIASGSAKYNKAVDFGASAVSTGLTALVHTSGPVAILIGALQGVFPPASRIFDKRRLRKLNRLAEASPGVIDYSWSQQRGDESEG